MYLHHEKEHRETWEQGNAATTHCRAKAIATGQPARSSEMATVALQLAVRADVLRRATDGRRAAW